MKKILLFSLFLVVILSGYSSSFADTGLEYFPGTRNIPAHLNKDDLDICIKYSEIIKITKEHNAEEVSGIINTVDKVKLVDAYKRFQNSYINIFSSKCAGASYFKEDYDEAIKQVNDEYNVILNDYVVGIIESVIDFPFLMVRALDKGQKVYLMKNLLDNNYFAGDYSYNIFLGQKIDDENLIERSNRFLELMGFNVSYSNLKQNIPDKKAVLAFKLHLNKINPYFRPASPLYNLDLKTYLVLEYCYENADPRCFLDKDRLNMLRQIKAQYR